MKHIFMLATIAALATTSVADARTVRKHGGKHVASAAERQQTAELNRKSLEQASAATPMAAPSGGMAPGAMSPTDPGASMAPANGPMTPPAAPVAPGSDGMAPANAPPPGDATMPAPPPAPQ